MRLNASTALLLAASAPALLPCALPNGHVDAHLIAYVSFNAQLPETPGRALREHCDLIFEGLRRKLQSPGLNIRFEDAASLSIDQHRKIRERNRLGRPNREVFITITNYSMPGYNAPKATFGATSRSGQIAVFIGKFDPPANSIAQLIGWIIEVLAHELGHTMNLRVRIDPFAYILKGVPDGQVYKIDIAPRRDIMNEHSPLRDEAFPYDTSDGHNANMFLRLRLFRPGTR